jgi:hypothetical protein
MSSMLRLNFWSKWLENLNLSFSFICCMVQTLFHVTTTLFGPLNKHYMEVDVDKKEVFAHLASEATANVILRQHKEHK